MRDIPIGRISGVFGLRGELKCDPTGAGRSCFFNGSELDIELPKSAGGTRATMRVRSVREHKRRLLVAFEGVPDATAAERYPGATVYAAREQIALDEGEHLDEDLVGCNVVNVKGTVYGRVERVEEFPAGPMLIVAGRMIPFVDAFIIRVDVDAKEIVVDVPPGLMDDEGEEA